MRQIRTLLDRIATLAALRLLAWIGKHVDPGQQLWLDALRAELDAIDGGIARFVWAVGGLRLIWFERRQHLVNATYRYGPVLLNVLGLALLIGLTWSLIQQYGSIAVIFFELTGGALLVALPVAIGLVYARRSEAEYKEPERGYKEPERHMRPLLPLVLGVLGLVTLFILWLSAPLTLQSGYPTAGVVVRSADHHTAEAALDQTVGPSHYEAYLTTQVKPLAVNGVPLAQMIEESTAHMIEESTGHKPPFPPPCLPPPVLHNDVQVFVDRYTGIQGYDLAHGQLPPDGILDAHDANTLNVVIPLGEMGGTMGCSVSYYTNIGSTITVQSLTTGRTLNLYVVGEYDESDGFADPLFGKILADDSVVRALSGGHPSSAYSLDLNMNQRQAVFERLHTSMPTAQLYDFTTETMPSYSKFTDPYPANIWDYNPFTPDPPLILGAIAIVWAGLLAIIIALNWEARTLISQSGLGNRRKG